MPTLYYVYAYVRPDTNHVFYIGKGTKSRAVIHLSGSHNIAVARVIAKLRRQQMEPEVKLVFFGTDEECKAEEVRLIALHGRRDRGKGFLMNMTDGGDGTTQRIVHATERALHRVAATSQWADPGHRQKKLVGIRRSWQNVITRANRLRGVAKAAEKLRERYANSAGLRKRLSDQIKRAWNDPAFRKKASENARKRMSDPLKRKHLSDIIKRRFLEDPQYRKKVSMAVKALHGDPRFREKFLKACADPERRRKIAVAATGRRHSENTKGKLSQKKRKLSTAQVDEARNRFFQGTAIAPLAKAFGVSYTVIYRALFGKRRAYSIGAPNPEIIRNAISTHRMRAAKERRLLTAADVEVAAQLRVEGASLQSIAERFGVSRPTISNILSGRVYRQK